MKLNICLIQLPERVERIGGIIFWRILTEFNDNGRTFTTEKKCELSYSKNASFYQEIVNIKNKVVLRYIVIKL